MMPEYHSFLRAQVDRLFAAGGSKEEIARVAESYLIQERALKVSNVSRLESSSPHRLRIVDSGR